jgi:microcystin-dependent protein
MSNCSNCYNGCTEIVSDKCVKYTGPNITELGITTGDTLLSVEQAIINYLVPVLTGAGISPVISNSILCQTVSKYLPNCSTCNGFTLNQILTATISAICDLQEQVTAIDATLDILNANYDISCLTGVTSSSDTHAVVQATITALCTLRDEFDQLVIDLPFTYVSINNINEYIEEYIEQNNSLSLFKNRMVPYTAVPYYGTLSNFDGTGAGLGNWVNVYLCNGQNFTPDLRGRTLVGSTSMLGGPLNPAVDPAISGNPAYTFSGTVAPLTPSTTGANQVTLLETQIPSHTHTITSTATVNDPGHFHNIQGQASGQGFPKMDNGQGTTGNTTVNTTGISVNVSSSASYTGGSLPHANVQPSATCYYIMYIP